MILQDLIKEYILLLNECNIEKNNDLFKLNKKFSYYIDYNAKKENLIEIDIKSAFPTLCNILFVDDDFFLKKLNTYEDKFEKNKFLTIYLKHNKKYNNINYLTLLNKYSKLIIFTYVLNNYNVKRIYEFKKDSLLFSGIKNIKNKQINNFFSENNISFHIKNIDYYFRLNNSIKFKSSLFIINNNLYIKGALKNTNDIFKNILKKLIKNDYNNFDFITNGFHRKFNPYNIFNDKIILYNHDVLLSEIIFPIIKEDIIL